MAQEVATPTQQLFIEFYRVQKFKAGVRIGLDAIARPFPTQV